MTKAEIEETVKTVLIEEFKVEPGQVEPDATFKKLGLDSLDLVSLVMALEDRLGVEIPEGDLEGVERLDQAVAMLEQKLAAVA